MPAIITDDVLYELERSRQLAAMTGRARHALLVAYAPISRGGIPIRLVWLNGGSSEESPLTLGDGVAKDVAVRLKRRGEVVWALWSSSSVDSRGKDSEADPQVAALRTVAPAFGKALFPEVVALSPDGQSVRMFEPWGEYTSFTSVAVQRSDFDRSIPAYPATEDDPAPRTDSTATWAYEDGLSLKEALSQYWRARASWAAPVPAEGAEGVGDTSRSRGQQETKSQPETGAGVHGEPKDERALVDAEAEKARSRVWKIEIEAQSIARAASESRTEYADYRWLPDWLDALVPKPEWGSRTVVRYRTPEEGLADLRRQAERPGGGVPLPPGQPARKAVSIGIAAVMVVVFFSAWNCRLPWPPTCSPTLDALPVALLAGAVMLVVAILAPAALLRLAAARDARIQASVLGLENATSTELETIARERDRRMAELDEEEKWRPSPDDEVSSVTESTTGGDLGIATVAGSIKIAEMRPWYRAYLGRVLLIMDELRAARLLHSAPSSSTIAGAYLAGHSTLKQDWGSLKSDRSLVSGLVDAVIDVQRALYSNTPVKVDLSFMRKLVDDSAAPRDMQVTRDELLSFAAKTVTWDLVDSNVAGAALHEAAATIRDLAGRLGPRLANQLGRSSASTDPFPFGLQVRLGAYLDELDVPRAVDLARVGNMFVLPPGAPQAVDIIRSTLLRLVVGNPPGSVCVTLLDPSTRGALAPFLQLPSSLRAEGVRVSGAEIESTLLRLLGYVDYLTRVKLPDGQTLADFNAEHPTVALPYQVVTLLGAPTGGWDGRAADALRRIIEHGPRAGVHLLASIDLHPDELTHRLAYQGAIVSVRPDGRGEYSDASELGWSPFAIDRFPAAEVVDELLRDVEARL